MAVFSAKFLSLAFLVAGIGIFSLPFAEAIEEGLIPPDQILDHSFGKANFYLFSQNVSP